MDAPTYPPALAFSAPVRQPRPLESRSVSIDDLLAVPGVRAIILREMPVTQYALDNADMRPHLSNLTLHDLLQFGLADADGIARIDRQLATMGTIQ